MTNSIVNIMNKQIVRSMAFAAAMLMLIGADIDTQSAHLIRTGNDAFHRQEFKRALTLYEHAEERITDPGLAAFNKAVVLFRLEEYRQAEEHFRRSLEQAQPNRRANSYYGLGNALLMQGRDLDVAALRGAVAAFRLCRKQPAADEKLRDKAEHNLELARLLLIEALKKKASEPPENGSDKNGNGKNGKQPGNGNNPDKGDPAKTGQNPPNPNAKGNGKQGGKSGAKSAPVPGAGRLPTIPDDGQLRSLSPEDVQRLLREAIERIQQQKRQDWRERSPVSGTIKDW